MHTVCPGGWTARSHAHEVVLQAGDPKKGISHGMCKACAADVDQELEGK